ncbi:RHS repeat-associated core domain-containing protein [Brevibacillus centrosporus]|uniref:RHS repeat domain-containing protein n=1 Tax=Brevibacillus centrosporus TaxID=54910 RepID=UPI003D20C56C
MANVKEVDLQLDGKHGMDFKLERTFSTLDSKKDRPYLTSKGKNKADSLNVSDDYLAMGWSFNFPTYEEIIYRGTKCTYYDGQNRSGCGAFSKGSRYIFTLEDGTVLESSSKTGDWVNYPYNDASMKVFPDQVGDPIKNVAQLTINGNVYLFQRELVGYDDSTDINLVTKTNSYGDKITYRLDPNDGKPVEIVDSVGRHIVLEKERNGMAVTALKVYQDTTDQTLLKHVEYVGNQFGSLDKIIEHDVIGSGADKVIAEYTYYDPDLHGKAEFNFVDSYSMPATAEQGIALDENGVEAKAYSTRDLTERGVMRYRLIQRVNYPVEGLTMTYTYNPYQPDTNNFLNPSQVRLYYDEEKLIYSAYPPVTAVNFRFSQTAHPDTQESKTYSFTKYYPLTNKEIWKSPKAASTRLKNQTIRDGSIVVSQTMQAGLPSIERTFVLNEGRNFLPRSVKTYVGTDADTDTIEGKLELTEEGKEYRYAPATYTSFLYEGNATKPLFTFSFAGRPSSMTDNADVYAFLLAPTTANLPRVKARLPLYAEVTEYVYNSYGDVVSEKDPKGNVTTTKYLPATSTFLRLPSEVKKTAAGNASHYHQETYTYQDNLLATEKIVDSYPDGVGVKVDQVDRTYTYNNKLVASVTETSTGADAKTVTQTISSYDDLGLYPKGISMSVETSPSVQTKLTHTFIYDALGRLQARIYPDQSFVQYQYDTLGRPVSEQFSNTELQNRTITYTYEDGTRKVTTNLPDGTKNFTHFTPYGEVEYKGQVGTDGTVRPLLYNTYSLDGNHIVSSEPYALKDRATTYVYNQDGTVWQKKDPKGTTVYLSANTMSDGTNYLPATTTLTVEPNGLQTTAYHDRHGQQEKEVSRTSDGTQSRTLMYGRNDFDQVIRQTEKDQTGGTRAWSYRYTNNGQLVYLLDPEQNTYQYEYDSLGNLATVTENQTLTTRNHYNSLSWKMAEEDAPSGAVEYYSYMVNGNPATFTDKAGNRHEYAYTPFYDLAALTTKNKAGTVTNKETKDYYPNTSLVKKETNSNGSNLNPTSPTYRETSYTYDPLQRMNSVTTFGRSYLLGYNDRDNLIDTLTYPDNSQVTYAYDTAERLQEVNSPLAGVVKYDYHTDSTGESYQIEYPNGQKVDRKLDSFGQVERVTQTKNAVPVWTESNEYSFGNVTGIQRNGTSYSYEYDKVDRLTKETSPVTTNQYSYDGRGNRSAFEGKKTKENGSVTYTFDERNRLRGTANAKTGDSSDYTYYGDGLRATKVENGTETKYVYLNGKVIEELDAAGNVQARNIWGNELLFRHDYASGKGGYYGYNSHGDVVSVTNGNGYDLNSYEYDTWGNIAAQTEGMSNPFKYSGEIYDDKTGLYYLRARYYDPRVGRFISEDTYKGQVDNPLSLNRYTYTHNNPLRYFDPTGHITVEEGWNSFKKGWEKFTDSKSYEPAINALTDPKSYVPLTRELVGPESFDTLTDGQITFGDAKAAGMATFSFFMGRLKVLDKIGEVGKLTYLGNKTWKSSQGLIYGYDRNYGNRVKHVLEHTKPNPNKANHTVFSDNKTEVLSLVDEAWALKKTPVPGDPGAYIVDMGRKIGTQGETKIRIVVKPGTSEIITAYPVR